MMRWTQEMTVRFQSLLLETENGFFLFLSIIFSLLILCYYLFVKSNTDEGAVNRTSNEEVDTIAAVLIEISPSEAFRVKDNSSL